MKGSTKTSEVLLYVLMTLVILGMSLNFTKFTEDVHNIYFTTSSEIIARDLAGLISISGSAPDRITIDYVTSSEKYKYNVKVNDTFVEVSAVDENGQTKGFPSQIAHAIKSMESKSFNEKRVFRITKTRENGENKFYFEAPE